MWLTRYPDSFSNTKDMCVLHKTITHALKEIMLEIIQKNYSNIIKLINFNDKPIPFIIRDENFVEELLIESYMIYDILFFLPRFVYQNLTFFRKLKGLLF